MKKKNPFSKQNREEAKKQGYYDGRYRQRVVKDKKKEQSRTGARKNKWK